MTYLAEHAVIGVAPPYRPSRPHPAARKRQPGCRDRRWPALAAALDTLHGAHRRSVRIVDCDCGGGALLLCAVRYARAIGFTAIEARGIDDQAMLVDRARAAAADLRDPAIGISFEATDIVRALEDEADFPADIVLWHGRTECSDAEARAVACAGVVSIAEPALAA